MKSNCKHLCWTCQNACNRNKCIWVKTLKKIPNGAKRDNFNNIVVCPNYINDCSNDYVDIYVRQLSKEFNVSARQIYRYLKPIKKIFGKSWKHGLYLYLDINRREMMKSE